MDQKESDQRASPLAMPEKAYTQVMSTWNGEPDVFDVPDLHALFVGVESTAQDILGAEKPDALHNKREVVDRQFSFRGKVLELGSNKLDSAFRILEQADTVTCVEPSLRNVFASTYVAALRKQPIYRLHFVIAPMPRAFYCLDSASYDVVAALDVFEHITDDDYRHSLPHILRVLKPGGHLYIDTPCGWTECKHLRNNPQYRDKLECIGHIAVKSMGFYLETLRAVGFTVVRNLFVGKSTYPRVVIDATKP